MKTIARLAVAGLAGAASLLSAASAANIEFGPTRDTGIAPTITFENLITPTSIIGDAIFTFTVESALNRSDQNVEIFLDGMSLGTVFDNNETNDLFNQPDDQGAARTELTVSATIDESIMAGLIADGLLTVVFQFSDDVLDADTIVSGSITFDSNPIPLPAAAWIMIAGLGGMVSMRRLNAPR